jgi:type II secretory pathway component PulC
MRHPLWLVNSSLLLLLALVAGIVFLWEVKTPQRVKLETKERQAVQPIKTAIVDIKNIYENDLFNTYHKIITPPAEPDYTIPMPQPPIQTTVKAPDEPKQPFLQPLDVKLQGIIYLNDASNNIAMVLDKKTSLQKNYKVGDMILDARLIRIFSNRILLIRANGQQESIYLNEKDIESDPAYTEERANWLHVVKIIDPSHYLLDPETFVGVTKNLAQCIDMLDISTVYKQGKSIGCRIGNTEKGSLGSSMGLKMHDIISHINNLPITTQDERFSVYEALLKYTFGQSIVLDITREDQEITLSYKLHDLKDPLDESLQELQKEEALPGIHEEPSVEEVQKEQEKLLRNKYKFAPTLQDLKIQQKQAMLNQGKRKDK